LLIPRGKIQGSVQAHLVFVPRCLVAMLLPVLVNALSRGWLQASSTAKRIAHAVVRKRRVCQAGGGVREGEGEGGEEGVCNPVDAHEVHAHEVHLAATTLPAGAAAQGSQRLRTSAFCASAQQHHLSAYVQMQLARVQAKDIRMMTTAVKYACNSMLCFSFVSSVGQAGQFGGADTAGRDDAGGRASFLSAYQEQVRAVCKERAPAWSEVACVR